MRQVQADQVAQAVARLCQEANVRLGADVRLALVRARYQEESPIGRQVLCELAANARLASRDQVPMCQDTGTAVVFLEVGQEVHVVGGGLEAAVQRGVAMGYARGYLRMSMVAEPLFERRNTGDNTPAVIHARIVPGDRLRIAVAAKGGGAENMSRLAMLSPADGLDGVRRFVLDAVRDAGPNACPPVIVGVGVGGNFETCALLAKRALLRPVGQPHPDPRVAALEGELLARANLLGVGPQGLGGTVTALAVHLEVMGCHMATLPVAVNLQCHAHRHREAVL